MNPWASPMMMMPPWMMSGDGFGGYKGFSKAGKGKGKGKGGKAQAMGKGGMDMMMCQPTAFSPDLDWNNPQPARPCPKCLSKDHTKRWCPLRNHQCEKCLKYGHKPEACTSDQNLPPCGVCSRTNHRTDACHHKGKTCNRCKAVGHLEVNCPEAKNDSTSANQKKADEEPQWHCPTCFEFLNANVKICTGCRKKKPADAAPVAAKPYKPLAKAVDDWANWQPENGLAEFYPEDEEAEAKKKELEENISRMTKQYGNADSIVKRLEEDLKTLLKKKPTRSLVKDGVAVAQSVKDATEKAARMKSQAEMKLEKKIADRSNLEKKHIEGTKLMKEEYERKLKVVKETYESAKVKADEEVEQEKAKLEETKKEAIATVAQAHKAYGNLAAASTGSPQKIGGGQTSVATGGAADVVLVPTLPGYILHGNDISQEEFSQYMFAQPSLMGITPEMTKAIAHCTMQFMQIKSTTVPHAAQASVEPSPAGSAEADPKQQEQADMEAEDPLTSDEEENETREANRKGEEVQERAKIRRSAKDAKRSRSSKTTGVPGVKSTIGSKAA